MIKKVWFIVVLSVVGLYAAEDRFDDEGYIIQPNRTEKTNIVLVLCGPDIKMLRDIGKVVKKDLEFTDQFTVAEYYQEGFFQKENFLWYKGQGRFLVTMNMSREDDGAVEWRLYKCTKDGQGEFIKGEETMPLGENKKIPFLFSADDKFTWWVHGMSHDLYRELTGAESPFLSKIAYCKQAVTSISNNCVCVADYDGSHETVIVPRDQKGKKVKSTTIYIAPCWTVDNEAPQLLYSEYTSLNMRLMMTDFMNPAVIVTDFNGSNMLPSFSQDGKEGLLCLSVQGKSDIYRYVPGKGKKGGQYLKISKNNGRNLSPAILKSGKIAFCSDYELNIPHVYIMDKDGSNPVRISESNGRLRSSATSPSYSDNQNKIAYVQEVKGIFQLMLYDVETGNTKQISFDNRHKGNPAWSPCGNYILCSVYDGSTKKLACYKLLTSTWQTIRPLSKDDLLPAARDTADYTYPAWSQFLEASIVE